MANAKRFHQSHADVVIKEIDNLERRARSKHGLLSQNMFTMSPYNGFQIQVFLVVIILKSLKCLKSIG